MSLFQNAYGNFLSNALPYYQSLPAIATPYGTLLKPGGRVAAYVRSTGAQDGEDYFASSGLLVGTMQAGLARCRAGMNDIVYVLPGHTENIAAADAWSNMVAGTQVVGVGVPGASNNPTFTWTATAGTLALDTADCVVSGLNLVWNGIDAVVAPMTLTARGILIAGNTITCASATAGALTGIAVSTGAANTKIMGNKLLSVTATKAMTGAPVVISAVVDDCVVLSNYISNANPGTATLGLIAVTAAATNLQISGNTLIQLNTAGTALFTVTVGAVAATGVISYNNSLIATDVVSTTSGVTVNAAAAATMGVFENRTKDATATNGVLSPVAAA